VSLFYLQEVWNVLKQKTDVTFIYTFNKTVLSIIWKR